MSKKPAVKTSEAEFKQRILLYLADYDGGLLNDAIFKAVVKAEEPAPPIVRLLQEMCAIGLLDMKKERMEGFMHPQWTFAITKGGKYLALELKNSTDPTKFKEFFELKTVPSEWVEQAIALKMVPSLSPGGEGI